MPSYAEYVQNLMRVGAEFQQQAPRPFMQRRVFSPYGRQTEGARTLQAKQDHLFDLGRQAQKAEYAKEQLILDARLDVAQEQQKHENRLKESLAKSEIELRQFGLERLMQKDDLDAARRNKESLTQLHDAQRQKIVSEPLMKKWESLIRQQEAAQAQKNRMTLESSKQQHAVNFETFKQENQEKVKRIEFERKQQLEGIKLLGKKIPQAQESTYEQLDRLRASGMVSTVGDVTKFWYGKGKKGDELEALVKGEMRGAKIDYTTVLDSVGRFTGPSKQEAWEALYRMPLHADQAAPETNNVIRQWSNLVEAEMDLKRTVKRNEALGMPPAQVKDEEAIMLDRFQRAFPDQASIYHQLSPDFPEQGTAEFPPVEIIPEQFKQLFDRIKVSAEAQGEITKFLKDAYQRQQRERGPTQIRERLHALGVQK